MSSTLTIDADRSAMIDAGHPETNYSTGTVAVLGEAGYVQYRGLLVGFPAASTAENQFKRIMSASLRAYLTPTTKALAEFYAHALAAEWTEDGVTFAVKPESGSLIGWSDYSLNAGYVQLHGLMSRAALKSALEYGVLFDESSFAYSGLPGYAIDTSRSSSPPQLVLTLADEDAVPEVSGTPSGGYVNKHTDITLSWTNTLPWTLATLEQTDATVRWREGSSGTVHEIGSLGELTSYTLAADAVSGSELQWQVSVTYNSGAVVTTPWYSLSTVEALSTAEIVRPKDTLVDASKPTSLEWRHVISTGTAQTAADLQTSTDGTAWSDLAQISGAANTYVVAAGTWTGGNRWWRVRTYNTDDAAGAWSEAAQIAVVGGPAQPVVACTSDPRPVISWQADGQQGYEAEIGGQSSGVVYGTGKRWQPPEFLPDGPATARVRVVNSYGLWSEWGTIDVLVTNDDEGSINLSAFADRDVGLIWDVVHDAAGYWIYRDGTKIGETTKPQFTDRWSNGSSIYKVRAVGEPAQPSRVWRSVSMGNILDDGSYDRTDNTCCYLKPLDSSLNPDVYVPIDGPVVVRAPVGYLIRVFFSTQKLVGSTTSNSGWTQSVLCSPELGAFYRVCCRRTDNAVLDLTGSGHNVYTGKDAIAILAGVNEHDATKLIGSYRDSNPVTATVTLDAPIISALDGEWIELRFSTEPVPTVQSTRQRPVSLLSVQGSVYPVAEASAFRQRAYSITAAFKRDAGPAAFESLLGREVVLKDQYGSVIHGVMSAITTTASRFYFVCSAQIQEVDGVV